MIIKEFYRERKDGVKLYRTYSDEDFIIRKVGTEELYSEAIDVENAPYTYEETEEKIEREELQEEENLNTNMEEVIN